MDILGQSRVVGRPHVSSCDIMRSCPNSLLCCGMLRACLRNAPVRNAVNCSEGGYVTLQMKLARSQPVSCESCLQLLLQVGFKPETVPRLLAGERVAPVKASSQTEQAKEEQPEAKIETVQQMLSQWGNPMDWVRSLEPVLQVLPLGTLGKSVPVRCNICKTKRQPQGKVFDITCETNAKAIWRYVQQHLESPGHLQNMAPGVKLAKDEAAEKKIKECNGLRLFDASVSRVAAFRDEVRTWLTFCPRFGKHTYKLDERTGECYVRHSDCQAVHADGLCEPCRSLGHRAGVLKLVYRFSLKYNAAKLLAARLYGNESDLADLKQRIEKSALFTQRAEKMRKIMSLSNAQLQQYVRSSFTADGHERKTACYNDFIETVVRPCLRVNVGKVDGQFPELLARLTGCLASGKLTEISEINAQIACAALSGRLDDHPLVQGLAVSAMRLLEKREAGLSGLRGRPRAVSETEYNLVADAGVTLACAGGNKTLAKEFGQRLSVGRIAFDEMDARGFARPALAVRFPSLLRQNLDAIDKLFVTVADMPVRRLFVAFDCTYLQPSLMQCCIQNQIGLVGGKWMLGDGDQSFLKLGDSFEILKLEKARQMLLCSMNM